MMMDFKDRYKVSIGLFIIDILFISYHFLNIKYIHKLSKISLKNVTVIIFLVSSKVLLKSNSKNSILQLMKSINYATRDFILLLVLFHLVVATSNCIFYY